MPEKRKINNAMLTFLLKKIIQKKNWIIRYFDDENMKNERFSIENRDDLYTNTNKEQNTFMQVTYPYQQR